jgi:hypothetical protein
MHQMRSGESAAGGAHQGEVAAPARWPAGWRLAAAALVLAYGALLAATASPHASGSDQSGYLSCARLLASGERFAAVRPVPGTPPGQLSPWLFTPLGFAPAPTPGLLVPTYPPGFPLHLAALSFVLGWEAAAVAVQALAGAALLLLVCLLGRELGLPPSGSLAAALLVAAFPVTLHFFTWMMSDGLATTWCCAAVLAALLARRGAAWGAAAGFSFAVAVMVRPTDVLLLPALALALPRRRAAWLAFAAGAAPGALLLAAYDAVVYGSVLSTGYRNVGGLFSAAYFLPRIAHFATWIGRFLTLPVSALWLVGVGRAVGGDRRQLLLLAWLAPVVAFYALYFHSIESWWYLRFILPAVPAFVLGSVLAGHELLERLGARVTRRCGRAAVAVLALLVVGYGVGSGIAWSRHFGVLDIAADAEVYPRSLEWLELRTPPGTPVAAMQFSGALFYGTERPLVRYDIVRPEVLRRIVNRARRAGAPLHALVFDWELERLQARHPGLFVELARRPPAVLLAAAPPAQGALRGELHPAPKTGQRTPSRPAHGGRARPAP